MPVDYWVDCILHREFHSVFVFGDYKSIIPVSYWDATVEFSSPLIYRINAFIKHHKHKIYELRLYLF